VIVVLLSFLLLALASHLIPRISSHYPERADETYKLHGPQRGIDISEPEVKLPTSKKTILFFRLADMYDDAD
jgi:hypothetical protein